MTNGNNPWSKFNAHRWSVLNAHRQNTGQIVTLFALANLWLARKRLLPLMGEVRPCNGKYRENTLKQGQIPAILPID